MYIIRCPCINTSFRYAKCFDASLNGYVNNLFERWTYRTVHSEAVSTERRASQKRKPPTRLSRYCGWDAQASPPMRKGREKCEFNNESHKGVQWQDFFQMADTSRLRGHPLKLRKDRSRLDWRKFTFSQRVVNMWNDLPWSCYGFSSEDVQKQARGPPEKPP